MAVIIITDASREGVFMRFQHSPNRNEMKRSLARVRRDSHIFQVNVIYLKCKQSFSVYHKC